MEKPLQIEELSLSDKDVINEKENSIMNKSFFSTDLNFPDLIDKKNYIQIKIESLEFHIQISSKSIRKIITLISNNKNEIEDNYLDYITCLFGEGEDLDKNQLLPQDNNQLKQNILEPSYYELLRKTNIYYIDIPKKNSKNKNNNNKINLRKKSLEKITSFLNITIFDISDFIEIFILSYQENAFLGERLLLNAKLMGKMSQSLENINNENEEFNGVKEFKFDIIEIEKCKKQQLHFLDFYFNNVWNAIEKENLNDENLSFSGTPLDKNDKNKKSNNINYDLPNSNNINESRNRDHENKNGDLRKIENPCADNVCADMCKIF